MQESAPGSFPRCSTGALRMWASLIILSSWISEIILLKTVRLKSSKWDQNGILKTANSIKATYVRIVFILADGVLKCNLPSKRKMTKYRIWLIYLWQSDVVLLLSCGSRWGEASPLSRRNTVHQKCLFFHTRAEIHFNRPSCPFCLKIKPLILPSTIASGRVSTCQSQVRYSQVALLPSRLSRPCRWSHFPAETWQWSGSARGWGGFLLPWQPVGRARRRATLHRPGWAVLTSHLPYRQTKTTQESTRDLDGMSWSARHKPLPRPAGCASNQSEEGVLSDCSTQLTSRRLVGWRLPLLFHHSPLSFSAKPGPACAGELLASGGGRPPSPPHLSWVPGRPKPRLHDRQEQAAVSWAMSR